MFCMQLTWCSVNNCLAYSTNYECLVFNFDIRLPNSPNNGWAGILSVIQAHDQSIRRQRMKNQTHVFNIQRCLVLKQDRLPVMCLQAFTALLRWPLKLFNLLLLKAVQGATECGHKYVTYLRSYALTKLLFCIQCISYSFKADLGK